MSEEEQLVRIALPLPLDVAAGIMSAIGTRWPDSVVKSDAALPGREELVMALRGEVTEVDEETLGEISYAQAATPEAMKAYLTSVKDGTLGVSVPGWISKVFVGMFGELLSSQEAQNFVELRVLDDETGEPYTVTVIRPKGKTPMDLLSEAQTRIGELEDALANK
jgi:hypothetical protein